MNKNKKIVLTLSLSIAAVSLITFGGMLYRPVHICKSVMPYADTNYCFAVSRQLPKVRKQCKLKYSLLGNETLTQIFTNIKNFQANTDPNRSLEFTSPEIIGNMDKRNEKIDEMVQGYIKILEDSIEANKYHARYLEKQTNTVDVWNNFEVNLSLAYGQATIEELEEDLKNAKENGVFYAELATRLRQFRALGTPYCEISSLGEITDCKGEYVGTVKDVFKPLGTNNQSGAKKPQEQDERIVIAKAVKDYTTDKAKDTAKEMKVSVDCATKYNDILQSEGNNRSQLLVCSETENQAIKSYWAKVDKEAQESGGFIDNEPIYGNAGMPKSLVLKGVSIICFEKANMGDNSQCTTKQLNIIEKYFKENTNIDWSKESFTYPMF